MDFAEDSLWAHLNLSALGFHLCRWNISSLIKLMRIYRETLEPRMETEIFILIFKSLLEIKFCFGCNLKIKQLPFLVFRVLWSETSSEQTVFQLFIQNNFVTSRE